MRPPPANPTSALHYKKSHLSTPCADIRDIVNSLRALFRFLSLTIVSLALLAPASSLRAQFTTKTLTYPGAFSTQAVGVSGNIVVGNYLPSEFANTVAFQYSNNLYKKIMPANGASSQAAAVSGNTVVGNCTLIGHSTEYYPFVYNGVTAKVLYPPGTVHSQAVAVDGANVVGVFFDNNNKEFGFLYANSTFTTIDYPGSNGTVVTGVSGNTVLGGYSDSNYMLHGFTYTNGVYTPFDPPGSSGTFPIGISGTNIVGQDYIMPHSYSFFYDGTTYTTVTEDPPPASGYTNVTCLSGTNLAGGLAHQNSAFFYNGDFFVLLEDITSTQALALGISGTSVAGFYVDANNVNYGFLATAITPTATTQAAGGIGTTAATLHASVNGKGSPLSIYFEYGTTTAYGTTSNVQVFNANNAAQPVSESIASLSPNTVYHYRVVASTGVVTVAGADMTFKTPPVPSFVGFGSSFVGGAGSTLSESYNPNGLASSVYFVYGLDTSYGNQTATQNFRAGSAPVTVLANLNALQPGTTYHYQMVVVTANGTFTSADASFTTLPQAPVVVVSGDGLATFGPPSINANDHAAFTMTTLATKVTAIMADDQLGVRQIIAATGTAPLGDVSGRIFATLGNPVYNSNDKVAFVGTLKAGVGGTTTATASGVWVGDSTGLTMVARSGVQAPGQTTGVTFKSFTSIALNDHDELIVLATLNNNLTAHIAAANNTGIWKVDNGTLTLKAQTGTGTPKITALNFLTATGPVSGQTRSFDRSSRMIVYTVTASDKSQTVTENVLGINLTPVVSGTAANGIPGANFLSFSPVILNSNEFVTNAGHIAFKATVTNQTGQPAITATANTGIWADSNSAPQNLVARTGSAPLNDASGKIFATLGDPVYNNNDKLAFLATYKAGVGGITTATAGVVYFGNSDGLISLAQQGAQAPGCPTGATFKSFDAIDLADQGGPNNKGSTIIRATLNPNAAAGVTTANNVGIWAVDDSNQGVLQLIVRTGNVFNGKTITALTFLPTLTTTGGQSSSVTQETGDIIYLATFSDKSQAIFKVVF